VLRIIHWQFLSEVEQLAAVFWQRQDTGGHERRFVFRRLLLLPTDSHLCIKSLNDRAEEELFMPEGVTFDNL
jgi:hypothetical protein